MAYQADIQLKITGLAKLKQVENRVKKISTLTRGLKLNLKTTQATAGINRLNKQVDKLQAKLKNLKAGPVTGGGVGGAGGGGFASAAKGVLGLAAAYITLDKAASLAANSINEAVGRESAEQRLALVTSAYGEQAAALDLVRRNAAKFGQSQTETTKAVSYTHLRAHETR